MMDDNAFGVRSDAATSTIEVAGELDLGTASILGAAVEEMRAGGATTITLDMSSLTFIDSSGLSALLTARQSGAIHLANTPGQLVRLLTVTSTSPLFE
jgi:anti-sigma B factor antagonist